jgi:hypothetical protein
MLSGLNSVAIELFRVQSALKTCFWVWVGFQALVAAVDSPTSIQSILSFSELESSKNRFLGWLKDSSPLHPI